MLGDIKQLKEVQWFSLVCDPANSGNPTGGHRALCSSSYSWCWPQSAGNRRPTECSPAREKRFFHPLSDVELEEHDEENREEETARQKEFLEKVVVSQKGQLRQLEKVGAGENIALFY